MSIFLFKGKNASVRTQCLDGNSTNIYGRIEENSWRYQVTDIYD